MGRKMRPRLSEGKKEIIRGLISEYEIKTAEDIQNALKDLLGETLGEMLESELDEHLGYEKYEQTETKKENYRNGHTSKRLKSSQGELQIDVPNDRNYDFTPEIVPKYKKDISDIESKIINMYARGQSTSDISEQIEEIYGFKASSSLISKITDKIVPMVEDWSNRRLSEVYPIVFIDAIHFSVRKDKVVQKLASYIVLGINSDGMKEVLSIEIGETESSRFWLSVLNALKNRGVKDILILCSDGLSGLKEAINTAFPDTEHQRCIVHIVRNTLKHVSHKDKKDYASDLKTIYHAADEETAFKNLEEVKEKWDKIYKNSMKEWEANWNLISPIFKYPMEVRKAFYTTNAIESLNSEYRRINKARSVFPNEDALKKALYLATMKISKKWTMKIKDFGKIIGQLEIFFEGRI